MFMPRFSRTPAAAKPIAPDDFTPVGRGGPDAALARRARPVERDDQSIHPGRIGAQCDPAAAGGFGGRDPLVGCWAFGFGDLGSLPRRLLPPPPARPRISGALSGRHRAAVQAVDAGPGRSGPGRAARSGRRPRRTSGAAGASSPARGSPGTSAAPAAAGADELEQPRGLELGHRAQVGRASASPSSSAIPARRAVDLVAVERRRAGRARTRARRRTAGGGRARPSRRRW